ncbi:MAG: hypothetical protein GEU95_11950 [Rhizobiales bacterium]|nr:hypothetical protein [Hyphomicrobiales bacterium]
MLANNFMTPLALGISDIEFDALVKVLGMLERGEISDEQFTMRRVQHPCRTPACLCGWANDVSAGRAFPLYAKPGLTMFSDARYGPRWRDMPRPLLELFAYGRRPADPVYAATPSQAAIALRNFLTQGQARWAEALAA